MRKKLKSTVFLLCISSVIYAQNVSDGEKSMQQDNSSFTFTESQLGEDDDASQNVIVINSNNNIYTNDVGYRFSQARFKYRAYQSFYQDTYINGAKVNDLESGQFRYSNIGGLNDMVRSVEFASPFESNNFSMPGIGGSNNYDFRASHYATGSKATLSACNRNYTARAMYSFGTGLQKNGWAFAGMASYRWADEGNVEGTFYNSLGYFLSAEKVINDAHSISFATWGNPTERAAQGASTDEAYWLANDNQYNPYWGYQNGKKRNSRITSSYEPSAVITWDWNIDKTTKLITTLTGKYSIYSSTKLNYNGTSNPAPDYWKNMPSSLYDVWDATDKTYRTDLCLSDWQESYNYWKSSKANRQINWDKLYFANQQINAVGGDAGYYVQAKHINNLAFNFSSTLQKDIDNNSKVNMGINLGTNKGMHYQTMEDLLGADSYHNINTYALGTYSSMDDRVQYDLNHRDAEVKVGDRFGYDYNLYEQKAEAWVQYIYDRGHFHTFVTGKIDGTQMYREGNMRNGLSPNNSYGKSGTAHFMGGGGKIGTTYNLGSGNVITLGVGYEQRAPLARNSFAAPEINNNFVSNLKTEEAISAELGYALDCPWLKANITGYYTHIGHATEWQNYYYDDINSFTYVSLTNIQKAYYGVEAGMKFKFTSDFDVNAIATISDAKYMNNAKVTYMNSTTNETYTDICMNKGMRESGTPLSAYSLGLSYHAGGWFLDLNENFYQRIYLSYSASYRYTSSLNSMGNVDNNNNYIVPEQAKGNGGFMTDVSIGKLVYLKHGRMSINLMLNNILNNERICTGGYEQSRSDYTISSSDNSVSQRAYKFSKNAKKYYAQGFNFMLNVNYKF